MELQPIEIGISSEVLCMHLVHRDRNYIYNFWPRKGESIAKLGGGLSQCYIHAPIMSSQDN